MSEGYSEAMRLGCRIGHLQSALEHIASLAEFYKASDISRIATYAIEAVSTTEKIDAILKRRIDDCVEGEVLEAHAEG